MKIENEIKAKVFAQYLGQEFKWSEETDEDYVPILSAVNIGGVVFSEEADDSGEGCYSLDECKLILKPLSAITDEDAFEVGAIMYAGQNITNRGKDYLKSKSVLRADVYQFLQSKGYDLPNYLLGGKTLHEVGLAIYE